MQKESVISVQEKCKKYEKNKECAKMHKECLCKEWGMILICKLLRLYLDVQCQLDLKEYSEAIIQAKHGGKLNVR